MKVYTEIKYIWKDDKLVQTDSKSFDYEGEVTQCHTKKFYGVNQPHAHGGEAGKIADEASNAGDTWQKLYGNILNQTKPGGSTKDLLDWGRDLSQKISHHAFGSAYPGSGSGTSETDQDAIDALNFGSRRGFQGKGKNKKVGSEDMRREPYAMNTKTLLTQGQKAKKLTA